MPRLKKTQTEGSIDVKRIQYSNGQLSEEKETLETIPCPTFGEVEVGRINVRGSITRNLGDFNSVRVEVGLELPCLPELSEVDRVYNIASNFVEEKIKAELDNATVGRNPALGSPQNDRPGIRRRVINR